MAIALAAVAGNPRASRQPEDWKKHLMTSIEIQDRHSLARKSLSAAMGLQAAGELELAQREYAHVLAAEYRVLDVLPLLAGIVAKRGDRELALYYWDKLLTEHPGHVTGLIEKGLLLHGLSRFPEAIDCFRIAKAISPANTIVRNNLAAALAEAGRKDEALVELSQLLASQPGNVEARHQFRRLASLLVPFWHPAMMNDTRRNDVFEAAIIRAIERRGIDAQVLDIGTGSGLLSLMAARAGATDIVTCEAVPAVARTAESIIAANGYGHAIKVFGKYSTDLSVGRELPRKADIFVSEILSSDLLAENVLSTFEDAHERLVAPDATVIPKAARAMGCLAASETLSAYTHVSDVSGFDVSLFNALAPQRLPLHGNMTEWTRLSDDFELVAVDLTAPKFGTQLQKLSVTAKADGRAVGVVQWLCVDLIDDLTFTNHPDHAHDGHWLQVLHTFPEPLEVRAGETVEMFVGHDKTSIIIAPASSR